MKDKDIIRQFNNIFPKDIVEEFLFPLDSYRFYLERLSLDPLTFFNKWSDIDRQSLSNKYLRKNTNFQLDRSYFKENNNEYDKLLKNNYMLTLPTKIKNFNIDGFFAVYLRKID